MSTQTNSRTLPFELGEPRAFRGLTLLPVFPVQQSELAYIGLDEASAHGLTVSEVGSEGIVELLALDNPLAECVLLYEGEELVGAKQNRIVEQTILIGAQSTLKIPAKCVERGRWARRSQHFQPAPRAAYPGLRKAQRLGQGAVWAEVAAKQDRLQACSETEAAEAMYVSRAASLEQYVQALPRLDGQSGVLVGIAGRLVCLDYVSRSEVFAGSGGGPAGSTSSPPGSSAQSSRPTARVLQELSTQESRRPRNLCRRASAAGLRAYLVRQLAHMMAPSESRPGSIGCPHRRQRSRPSLCNCAGTRSASFGSFSGSPYPPLFPASPLSFPSSVCLC